MTECTNKEFGRLIFSYEQGNLSDEEREQFESHLMECDYCFHELEKMQPIICTMRRNRTEILDALRQDGIHFDSLKEELLAHSRKDASLAKKVALSVSQAWAIFRQAQILVPAAGLLVAVVLVITLYQRDHRSSENGVPAVASSMPEECRYLLSSKPLPYASEQLRGIEGDAKRLFEQGMDYYKKNDYGDAVPLLKKAIAKASKEGQWWLYLGVCYYLQGNAKDAISALTSADSLSQHPSDKTQARWYLAQAYLLNKDPNHAIPLLQGLVANEPKIHSVEADSLLAKVLRYQENKRR